MYLIYLLYILLVLLTFLWYFVFDRVIFMAFGYLVLAMKLKLKKSHQVFF